MFKINNKDTNHEALQHLIVFALHFLNFTPFDCRLPKFAFFNWDSLHTRLSSHIEAWSYKKKKHKKIKAYRKSVWKEPKVKRCLLILDLKPFRS